MTALCAGSCVRCVCDSGICAAMSARAEQPMGETPSTFHPSFNAGVVIEARVERLTSDAGAVIVREVMERSGIIEWLTERLHDPRQPHLVTYPLADLLRTMLLLFAHGWRDQDDADALRLDSALRLAQHRARTAAGGVRDAQHQAAGRGGTPGLAADAVAAARHPDAGAQPAGAARGGRRTRRPAAASRARGPQVALSHHRRRRLAG